VLDLGCGAGKILSYLPALRYTGVDLSPRAIASAQKHFGAKARFVCADVFEFLRQDAGQYDLVMAIGLLHHLDDGAVKALFLELKDHMSSKGRLITMDGCREGDPSFVERWLLDHDRGEYVRTKEGYLDLTKPLFNDVRVNLERGLLRVPYTHCIMEITKDRS
jgi:SAM-dependent methyltransferase